MLISKFNNSDVDAKILSIEEGYNILLPKQYRDFLYKYNGGYTPKTKFKVNKISSDIKGFYGVGNVKLSLDNIELNEWIEKDLFPIASDSFGNYIAIGIKNEYYNKIYFCNHEANWKIDCIGDELNSFLNHCKSDQISEASRKSVEEREEALRKKGREAIITESLRQMWQAEIEKYSNMIQEEVEVL